ncbi:MAG: glycosyltransferase family A protein, partial [Bacteroidota bacterium]|nr:glycosyltransferase family A protein [Bacteroidota bacterium]
FHLKETLYTITENDQRDQEACQFAYVDPKNRTVQLEMEQVCTKHLKAVEAWLSPEAESINLTEGEFPAEATVIIPVRNRCKTIGDAIDSVLNQETTFPFNLIVIDNHSTDGTTGIIREKATKDSRIIHLIPDRKDLGIGGCWNEGIQHPLCGRFAIQLDSDDVYSSHQTLAKIVSEFYAQQCAMLVGSYRMCNFNLDTIPPGIIDHKEWTPENGKNNALRINGLGAPRAFFTPVLRAIKVPNTSYGEDYALGLQISRRWKIGRIFEVLYLCRRWEENSDASIDLIKLNTFNQYKDALRTIELAARQQLNKAGHR